MFDHASAANDTGPPGAGLRVGLVNNMADTALRRTEQQFRSLLGAASSGVSVDLVMTTLPSIPRIDWAAQHVAETYVSVETFLDAGLDAVIVTGAEPRARELSDETYWPALVSMFDWIDDTRTPTAYCCLAAHAAVLHRDGISRRPLAEKCFGVFEHRAVPGHRLTDGASAAHVLPHSRWNEILEADLAASGYAILSRSDTVGVGAFSREADGIDLHFQGHPEYGGTSLLREYRRDVRRFLTGERETYPPPPFHGINDATLAFFRAFEQRAMRARDVALFEDFPSFAASDARASPWRDAALQMYGNWLDVVAAKRLRAGRPADAPNLAAARL